MNEMGSISSGRGSCSSCISCKLMHYITCGLSVVVPSFGPSPIKFAEFARIPQVLGQSPSPPLFLFV